MKTVTALAFLLTLPATSPAEDTFGFSQVPIAQNADNFIPVAYAKTPLWQGTLAADASVTGNLATFSLSGCPAPSVPCYLRLRSGPLTGRYYHTTAGSTEGSIIVDTNGDNQAALAVEGDEAALIPFWTLAEFLPPTGFDFILPRDNAATSQCRLADGEFLVSSLVHLHGQGKRFPTNSGAPFYDPSHFALYNELNGGLGDQTTSPVLSVLFPNLQSAGTNQPLVDEAWPVAEVSSVDYLPGEYYEGWMPTHFIHSTTHWLDAEGNNLDSRILPPDSFVVLRVGTFADNPGHGAYLALGGTNEDHPVTVPLSTDGSSLQDTLFSFPIVRPTPFQNLGQFQGTDI